MRFKRVLALCLAALMCAPCAGAELKNGDRGGSVLRVQDELYARGYLAEEGDGQYGQRTETAVMAFQQDNNLDPTGIVDDATYDLLVNSEDARMRKARQRLTELGYLIGDGDESAAIARFQSVHGLEATGRLDDETMALLASREAKSEIALVQEQLIRLGYLQGAADGKLGDMTRAALSAFQLANGLEATGIPDEASRTILFSDSAVGDPVRMLQRRLIELGYLNGAADGAFGVQSIAALKEFQEIHGLEVTGEADDATLAQLFSDTAQMVFPTLNSVSTNRDAVQRLQLKLIELGFLDGGADGAYGAKTYDAVLAFQKHIAAQGYETATDGEANSAMQQILFGAGYSSYLSDVNPADEGSETKRIERRLSALGYMDAAADTIYDDYAVECMRSFQTASGLEPTGTADRAAIDALFAPDAARSEQIVLHAVRMGEVSEAVKYAQNALIRMGFSDQYVSMASGVYDDQTETALERLYAYLMLYNRQYAEIFAEVGGLSAAAVRTLMDAELVVFAADVGESSVAEEIARVQRRLRGLFFDVEANGVYGESTFAAVSAFQTANGLPATGIADRDTQRVLFSDSAVGEWTQYMLKVSIDNQRVYAYELDESGQYRQIDTFICSTGLGDTTPRGVFSSTTEPLDRWHYFTEFECWAQYAWRIEGTIYFHSVIFSEKDESTLRESSVYNLGRKASHGCIRLAVEDAKWIYDRCDAGTIVIIY